MKKFILGMLLASILVGLFFALSYAATTTVTLAWDQNQESDLAGYKLYESDVSGGPYMLRQTLGKVLTTQVLGVTDGKRCWVLTAFDGAANESGYSNEVCIFPDTTPPAIPKNLTATGLVKVP